MPADSSGMENREYVFPRTSAMLVPKNARKTKSGQIAIELARTLARILNFPKCADLLPVEKPCAPALKALRDIETENVCLKGLEKKMNDSN